MNSTQKQIHVERLVYSILCELDELLAIRNSADAGLLEPEMGRLSAAKTKLDLLASEMLLVRAA
jgi:hypothetical protein